MVFEGAKVRNLNECILRIKSQMELEKVKDFHSYFNNKKVKSNGRIIVIHKINTNRDSVF